MGQFYLGKGSAVVEGGGANGGDTLRDGYLGQCRAIVEAVAADSGQRAGQRGTNQALGTREHAVGQGVGLRAHTLLALDDGSFREVDHLDEAIVGILLDRIAVDDLLNELEVGSVQRPADFQF